MNKLETRKIITKLYQAGILISLHEGKLRTQADKDAITAELRSLIIDNKVALMAYFSEGGNEGRNQTTDIKPYPEVGNKFPLTFAQKQFWFIDQVNGGSAHYNLVGAMQIRGDFDEHVAEQAFSAIIARHEPLRTVYQTIDSELIQHVKTRVDFSLDCLDLSFFDQEEQHRQIEVLLAEDAKYVFDLSCSIMLKCAFVRTSLSGGTLLCNLHHIAADGWSIQILFREFMAFYQAIKNDEKVQLLPLPLKYSDYAQNQNETASSENLALQLEYWDNHLAQLPQLHELPLDQPRPMKQTYNGAVHYAEIGEINSAKINELSRHRNCTSFMVLHAVFSVLLYRQSGNSDIVLGTPIANRSQLELEPLIGLFVNTLVLRIDCSGNPSFNDFLNRIKNVNLKAQANKQVPFEHILETLQIERNPSFPPIFQIMFSMDNTEQANIQCDDFEMLPFEGDQIQTKVELTLNVTPRECGMSLRFEYNRDLFNEETITKMASHYLHLLDILIADPNVQINDIPLLSEQESKAMLTALNQTAVDYDKSALIHHVFEQTALQSPDETALIFNDTTMSYRELNEASNQLAHHLRQQGVTAQSAVGLCVERSIEMVVSMLAILKAGGHYIPIDPSYPLKRIRYIIEHSQVTSLIATGITVDILPVNTEYNTVLLDNVLKSQLSYEPVTSLVDNGGQSSDLAYIIYTSGSTGDPKGVMVSHQNVVNFFTGLDHQFGEQDTQANWLAVTSISFDISVLELLWNLTRGSRVVLMPDRPVPVSHNSFQQPLDFSLFYFAAEESNGAGKKYDLLLGGAKFADDNALSAIWVPERHFSNFGDQFPNPAIAAAAVSTITKSIKIRSGSVVLPLHDPIRVAEEWSMVDHLSNGRVELSIASGWHPNDFVFMPKDYDSRHTIVREKLAVLQDLWQGQSVSRMNGVGNEIQVHLHPKPIQQTLPVWITAAGSVDTFEYAGSIGANILTHLLGQNPQELAIKIQAYKDARVAAGYEADQGKVAVMLHTFIGQDASLVKSIAEQPFKNYLRHSINLVMPLAKEAGLDINKDLDLIIDMGFQRFYNSCGLFGTVDDCMVLAKELHHIGVTELACLIDFGIEHQLTLDHLPYIKTLQQQFKQYISQQKFLQQRLSNNLSAQELILKYSVTHMQCTPSFVNNWDNDVQGIKALSQLKQLCVGGEAISVVQANRLLSHIGGDLYNMYGPTETTIWSSIKKITKDKVLIGGPMGNTQFYIQDQHGQLVPKGGIGELLITGDGVSQGYYRNPLLTQERFIPCEFTFLSSSLAYKTGDLVRYLGPDCIEFIGRTDNQIKLNGFRIELGEIEANLLKLPQISQAVVVLHKEDALRRLQAYLVTKEAIPVAEHAQFILHVQQGLSDKVPAYMLPSVFVILDKLPLTPNGKLDISALPLGEIAVSDAVYIAPESDTEKRLSELWQEVLSVDRISITDNFFKLGGNSILIMALSPKIYTAFQVELSIKELFEAENLQVSANLIHFYQQKQENLKLLSSADENELEEVEI